jgi:serralysin
MTFLSSAGLSATLEAMLAWDQDNNHDGSDDVVKWGGGWGTSASLTYSFPGASGNSQVYEGNYPGNEPSSLAGFNSGEIAAAKEAIAVWAKCANVTFTEVADSSTTAGDLRFAIDTADSSYAHAYQPSSDPAAGDLWFSSQWDSQASQKATPGSYPFLTLMHEIGHTLGLKHPQDAPYTLDAAHDNYFYSIMSYDVKPNSPVSQVASSIYPTTPMYDDLLAIDALYGQSPNANPGNTNYIFYDTRHYWQTLDDYSGIDTIIYRGKHGGHIDLSGKTWSQLGKPIAFGDGTHSLNTVNIGPETTIENASGNDGKDTIIGNASANSLSGNGGADTINGQAGNDRIYGGAGKDTLNGGSGHDVFVYKAASDSTGSAFDVINGFNGSQDSFHFAASVKGLDHEITQGRLASSSFNADLAKAADASHLLAHHAVLFEPTAGNEKGNIFLIVDANGQAGFQAGHDYVIELNALTHPGMIAHDFA